MRLGNLGNEIVALASVVVSANLKMEERHVRATHQDEWPSLQYAPKELVTAFLRLVAIDRCLQDLHVDIEIHPESALLPEMESGLRRFQEDTVDKAGGHLAELLEPFVGDISHLLPPPEEDSEEETA